MPIKYIDALNEQNSKRKHAIVDLDDLQLDCRNPRFSSSTLIGNDREIKQSDIIEYLLQYGNISTLAESINKNGGLYDEVWISCYKNSNNKIIVLEGNRRITTCKLLNDKTLIPEDLNSAIYFPSVKDESTLSNIRKVKAIIYENENDAQSYIAATHTKPEIKRWETVEQCSYYYDQFIRNVPLRQISLNSGEDIREVQKKIKYFGIFKEVFDVVKLDYPHILVEDVNILPLVTKFFPHLASATGNIGLGLSFDKDKLVYYAAPESADIYKKILLKIGAAFFVREAGRGIDTESRISSSQYRISTEEIKSKTKVEELIISDLRIPGLFDLIKQYKSIKHSNIVTQTPPDDSSQTEAGNNSSNTENSTELNTFGRGNGITSPPPANVKVPEFFSNLNLANLDRNKYLGLYLVGYELKRISSYYSNSAYKQFPISSAFLLRSFIEQLLSERLKQVGRYDILVKKLKNNVFRSPELSRIIEVYLNDYKNTNYTLFWNDGNIATEFNKCFSGHGTKDQLDTIIHNPHLIQPDLYFLNSLANQGLKSTLQLFLDNL